MTRRNLPPNSTEQGFIAILEHFGLEGWHVHWVPRPSADKRGQVLPESRLILLFDESLEDARDTLLHEILEIKLQPMIQPYRTLVNTLIQWSEDQIYQVKEKAIDDLIPLLRSLEESEHDSSRGGGK